MSVALQFYERMIDAGEDKTRAKVMAEALEALEERYPQLKDIATQSHVRESELRLQKEIKEVEGRLQKEIREVEGRLQKEIREVEGRLQKEIETIRLEIKNVDVRLRETEIRLTQAIHRAVSSLKCNTVG